MLKWVALNIFIQQISKYLSRKRGICDMTSLYLSTLLLIHFTPVFFIFLVTQWFLLEFSAHLSSCSTLALQWEEILWPSIFESHNHFFTATGSYLLFTPPKELLNSELSTSTFHLLYQFLPFKLLLLFICFEF